MWSNCAITPKLAINIKAFPTISQKTKVPNFMDKEVIEKLTFLKITFALCLSSQGAQVDFHRVILWS